MTNLVLDSTHARTSSHSLKKGDDLVSLTSQSVSHCQQDGKVRPDVAADATRAAAGEPLAVQALHCEGQRDRPAGAGLGAYVH